jgi:predicted metal-dependent peptidase
MNKFTEAIYQLLKTERFYADFLLGAKVVWSDRVPTACVGIKNFTLTFMFNSKFINSLTTKELKGLIKHECLHVLFKHVPFSDKLKNVKRNNIAMDICINQYIEEIPKTGCTPEGLEKIIGKPVERFKDSNYYYNLLTENQNKIPKNMKTFDEHDSEGQTQNLNEVEAVLKERLMDAIKKSNAGSLPQAVQRLLKDLLQPSCLPWERIVRNFVAKNVFTERKSTRKKPNRRFGIEQPGIKKKRKIIVGVPVDSSGSVGDELFTKFIEELQRIIKNVGKGYFIDVDYEIHKIIEYSGKQKVKLERTGMGGTAYNPALKKCKELKCDVIIYMGDGDCADEPKNPGIPVLWVLPEGCQNPASFGKVINIR